MLVTIAEAKAAVPQLADRSDADIEAIIDLVVWSIQDHIQRPLEQITKTDLYITKRQVYDHLVFLDHYPITAVTSVIVQDEQQTIGTVAPGLLPLEYRTVWRTPETDKFGILARYAGWPSEGFFVSYTGGYTAETLPLPIRDAIWKVIYTNLASGALDVAALSGGQLRRERTTQGWEREYFLNSSGDSSRKDAVDGLISREVADILRKYRWKGYLL